MYKYQENVQEYVQHALNTLERKIRVNKALFNMINIITFIIALGGGVITPVIMSQMVLKSFPIWFFFTTAGLSATAAFLSGMLNFFLLKDNFENQSRQKVFIEQELIKYNDKLSKKYKKKTADYYLFTSVAAILGSKADKEEVGLE